MAQLSLRVGADDAQVPRLAHPLGLLLHGALAHDRGQEHDKVDAHRVAMLCHSGAESAPQEGPGREKKTGEELENEIWEINLLRFVTHM